MKNPPPIAANLARITQLKRWSGASTVMGSISLLIIAAVAAWSIWQIDTTDYWVDHTNQVINTSRQLLFDLRDAEAAARAFLLQPASRYATRFQQADPRVQKDLARLRTLTADNAMQQERLDRLEPLVSSRLSRLTEAIAARSRGGPSESARIREEEPGELDADRVWDLSTEVQDTEYVLLGQRRHLRQVRLMEGFGLTLSSSLLALSAILAFSFQIRSAVVSLAALDRDRRENESMIASLFEAGPEAILIVDGDGTIVSANPECARLFGYRLEEITQAPAKDLVPETFHGPYEEFRRQYFDHAGAQPENTRLELPLRRKGQSDFFASVSIGRIASARGPLALAFVSDHTQRRAHEEALRTQAEQLRFVTARLLTAQEDERRRIARNLHDDLNQSLAYLAIGLGNLVRQMPGEEAAATLKSLQGRARESAELVRNISHHLHPAVLDDLGLEEAIRDLGDEFQERAGITVTVECDEMPASASLDAVACLYYVASECLRNVAKHAHATSVEIEISVRDGSLRLSVADDGTGIVSDPSQLDSGIGITTMRERLHILGGTLAIRPALPRGTQVDAVLPI